MVYTSVALWFRAESVVEGAMIALAIVLVVAYGVALWRAGRAPVKTALVPRI